MKTSTKTALQAVAAGTALGLGALYLTDSFPAFLAITVLASAGAYPALLQMKANQRLADRDVAPRRHRGSQGRGRKR